MLNVKSCELPSTALLSRYHDWEKYPGTYTDCYYTDIQSNKMVGIITVEHYVNAFYTSGIFKLERLVLKWLIGKPSSDDQAARLARGELDQFAAWSVEARTPNQLLMCDFQNYTRSWFMFEPIEKTELTRLYFGSAVVPKANDKTGKPSLGLSFRLLNGFHKVYSVLLLLSAKLKLTQLMKEYK